MYSSLKSKLLAATNREGLTYAVGTEIVTNWRKVMNLHNRLRRSARIAEHYRTNQSIFVQFGSGAARLPGFLNTDLFSRVPVDIGLDLPFPSCSVDLLYSNHLIEHICCYKFKGFLRESLRILKPSGIHVIGTPSLQKLISILYCHEDEISRNAIFGLHGRLMNEALTPAIFLNRFMHINYGHRFVYDFESISFLARNAGYADVKKIGNREVPNETIKSYVATKDEVWDLETETFVLMKEKCD